MQRQIIDPNFYILGNEQNNEKDIYKKSVKKRYPDIAFVDSDVVSHSVSESLTHVLSFVSHGCQMSRVAVENTIDGINVSRKLSEGESIAIFNPVSREQRCR